jgi:hypothetical protein
MPSCSGPLAIGVLHVSVNATQAERTRARIAQRLRTLGYSVEIAAPELVTGPRSSRGPAG